MTRRARLGLMHPPRRLMAGKIDPSAFTVTAQSGEHVRPCGGCVRVGLSQIDWAMLSVPFERRTSLA